MRKFKFSFRWRRKLKITREGRYFLGITVGVGLASIHTGNNLLYLLLGVLLALILISGVLSEVALRGLTVRRKLPVRAYVGRPYLVEIEVFNRKKKFPSYAIEVEDVRAEQPADKRCFFLKVSAQSSQVAVYRRTPQKRGREIHKAFRIATRFPFGFFEKSKQVELANEMIVYPSIHAVPLVSLQNHQRSGGTSQPFRGVSDEIFGVRVYQEGDDSRLIHWGKSATAGFWVLREHAINQSTDLFFEINDLSHLLNRASDDRERNHWLEHFEDHISDIASRAIAHLKRGDSVVIRTASGASIRGNIRTGSDAMLRFLALLEPQVARTPSSRRIKIETPSSTML